MGFFDRFSGSKPTGLPQASEVSPSSSKVVFAGFVSGSGATVDGLGAEAAMHLMLDFFRSVPAKGCLPREEDADMLLYQWGVYNWGSGESFEFNLTRQFTVDDEEGDDAISQLSLTLHFPPSESLSALTEGNRWCRTTHELNEFQQFITGSAAYEAVVALTPERVRLRWGQV